MSELEPTLDKNTKFCHACATQKRNKNQLHSIVESHSRLRIDQARIEKAFKEHYSETYKTIAPTRTMIKTCLQSLEPHVIGTMNESLQRDFTRAEMEEALKQIGPLKSPGSDGYGASFIRPFGVQWVTMCVVLP